MTYAIKQANSFIQPEGSLFMWQKLVWGLFFVLLGCAWIAGNLGIIRFDFGNWWPLVFVFIGLSILFSRPSWKKWEDRDWDDEDMRNEIARSVERISQKAAKKIRRGRHA